MLSFIFEKSKNFYRLKIQDTLEANLKKSTGAMKSALEETGTRINTNLELITHLATDSCLQDKNENYQIIKEKLGLAAFVRAQSFTDSVIQCANGQSK